MIFENNFSPGKPLCTASCSEPFTIPAPFVHPHEFISNKTHIESSGRELLDQIKDLGELQYLMELLTKDALSGLHLKSAFNPQKPNHTPQEMVDNTQPNTWFGIANLVSCLNKLLGIQTVSYLSENSGQLFVHLVPKLGGDENSKKSRKSMRGHTDGVIFPLNGQADLDPELPPGPDIVVLIGLENPDKVPTKIVPMSHIIRQMKPESVRQLMEKKYEIKPQLSFDLDGLKRTYQPILVKSEDAGYLIRYSHSKITPMSNSDIGADLAIKDLQAAIAASIQNVIIEQGDIFFINNRTAIHGRGKVDLNIVSARRWLLRTYGQIDFDSSYAMDPQSPYQLQRK